METICRWCEEAIKGEPVVSAGDQFHKQCYRELWSLTTVVPETEYQSNYDEGDDDE